MSAQHFRDAVPAGPTSTSLAIIDVRNTRFVACAAKNLDATQTVTVSLRRRASNLDDFADAQFYVELADIPPLTQRQVDVDVGSNFELEALGVASGAGATVMLTLKPDFGRRG